MTAAPSGPGTSRRSAVACATRRSKSTTWAAAQHAHLLARCLSCLAALLFLHLPPFCLSLPSSLIPVLRQASPRQLWRLAVLRRDDCRVAPPAEPGQGGGRQGKCGKKEAQTDTRNASDEAGGGQDRSEVKAGRCVDRRWGGEAPASTTPAPHSQASSAEARVGRGELAAHLAASLVVPWCCSGMAVASGSCGVATTSRRPVAGPDGRPLRSGERAIRAPGASSVDPQGPPLPTIEK